MTALLLALTLSASQTDHTVYLVRPLYPGQELLAQRTESAIRQFFQKDALEKQVIGRKELALFLVGKTLDLSCAFGEVACTDPTDAALRALGVDWILLIKGGQEESAYRYVVTAYNPGTGETQRAESAEPVLEKAILGALVKVVPLASAAEIECENAKATVLIDGEKVGSTPYHGQVLPGEHALRLESSGYIPFTETINVPARGQISLKRSLAGSPGKLIVHALPAEAAISVDGTQVGKGQYDQATSPGTHKLNITLDGYHPYEAVVTVRAGEPYTADVTLEATTGLVISNSLKEQRENIVKRTSNVGVDFEYALFGSPFGLLNFNQGSLYGVSVNYAYSGAYGGIVLVQPGILQSSGPITLRDGSTASMLAIDIRAIQPYLRLTLWRFALNFQVGPEGRYFMATNTSDSTQKSSQLDVDITAQISLRGFVWEGLYLEASIRQSFYAIALSQSCDPTTRGVGCAFTYVDRSPWWGFNVGLGYAF